MDVVHQWASIITSPSLSLPETYSIVWGKASVLYADHDLSSADTSRLPSCTTQQIPQMWALRCCFPQSHGAPDRYCTCVGTARRTSIRAVHFSVIGSIVDRSNLRLWWCDWFLNALCTWLSAWLWGPLPCLGVARVCVEVFRCYLARRA